MLRNDNLRQRRPSYGYNLGSRLVHAVSMPVSVRTEHDAVLRWLTGLKTANCSTSVTAIDQMHADSTDCTEFHAVNGCALQGTDENGCKVTDGDLISPAEFLLLLSSPDIDPETDVEAMERLAHIMESIGASCQDAVFSRTCCHRYCRT